MSNENTTPTELVENLFVEAEEEQSSIEDTLAEAAECSIAELQEELGEEVDTEEAEEEDKRWVTHEEALRLLREGVKPLLLRSDVAPHGYKKDGTPAAQRGRKLGSGKKRVLANPHHGNAGRTLKRTESAPHGVKLDGTPMKKRGRPTREQTEAKRLSENMVRAVQEASALQASLLKEEEGETLGVYRDPLNLCDDIEDTKAVVENKAVVRSPAVAGPVEENAIVRLVEPVCNQVPALLSRQGRVSRIDGSFAFIWWGNGERDWRAIPVLERC